MNPIAATWSNTQKISFRFFFIFLLLTSIVNWVLNLFFSVSGLFENAFIVFAAYKPLTGLFYWLDSHIYHTGYNPKMHDYFPQDNHFATVFYLTLLFTAIIGTLIWTMVDKNRLNYTRLFHWLNLYIIFVLAITIIGYGIDKLIPVQMRYPGIASLSAPYGDQTLMRVLWNFMGLSPAYMMMVGASEIVAGLLLMFRRTFIAGCLFSVFILSNVVAMNWFYNVPVKMFSAQLLFYTLFLIAPYIGELFRLFFKGEQVSLLPHHYTFAKPAKKYLLNAVMVVVALLFIIPVIIGDSKRLTKQTTDLRHEKMYDVVTFVAKDTLPPLTSDTVRWSRLALLSQGSKAIIYNMKNSLDYYDCDVDSLKKTFTFHDSPDKKKWHMFEYTYPAKNLLKLTGVWKGQAVNVLLKESPADSIPLRQEKIKLIND